MGLLDGDEIDCRSWQRARVLRALVGLFFVVAGGTAGFVQIEGWPIWKGLYFTLVTITTVGYGDYGLSEAAQQFTAVLLVGGIALASYSLSVVFQACVSRVESGKLRMQREIDRLEGHAVLCGFGSLARKACERLADSDRGAVVVARTPEEVRAATDAGLPFVEGTPTEEAVLEKAGLRRAAHVVAAMEGEAENIIAVLTARELAPEITVVALAECGEGQRKLRLAGADRIIAPFVTGGEAVADVILRPKLADFLAKTRDTEEEVLLADVFVEPDSSPSGGTPTASSSSPWSPRGSPRSCPPIRSGSSRPGIT